MNELLIILTSLFGGLNIFQFFFFRAEKRKAFAQADSMDLENARKAREIHRTIMSICLKNATSSHRIIS